MTTRERNQIIWEETIKILLGKDSPCEECIVRATCTKSFSSNSACEELAKRLQNMINKRNTE